MAIIWYLIFTEIYPKQTINKNRLFIFIPVLYRRKNSYCITVIFLFGTFKHYPQVTSFSWSCLLRSSGYRWHEIDGLAKIFCKALVATSSWDTCDRMDGACNPPWNPWGMCWNVERFPLIRVNCLGLVSHNGWRCFGYSSYSDPLGSSFSTAT